MATFFWRKSSQEQNVFTRLKIPFKYFFRERQFPQQAAVRHVRGRGPVVFPIVLLQGSGDYHRSAGQTYRRTISKAQDCRGDATPLLALPVEPLHRAPGFLSHQTWNKGE